MYADPYEKFVRLPVRRLPAPTPIVPRERVQPPPKVKAAPDPVPKFRLVATSGWPAEPRSVRSLVDVVSKVSKLHASDILGASHVPDSAKARHIVCWLARRFTSTSATIIAKHLRRKDHSAVLYGAARVDLAISEAPIRASGASTPKAWASALWDAKWPPLHRRDPLKL